MDFFTITIELVVGYIALFILTKLLGKGTISQLTPFDFITAIIIGELVGSAVFDQEVKLQHFLYGLFIWGLLVYGTELLSQKFKSTRKLLEGEPVIVINQGQIQRDVLKKNKLDINQLQHLLRMKDVFSIREVEYAILEADGQLTVLKKPAFASPTVSDLQLSLKPAILPVSLIIDGEVLWDNLKLIGKNEDWLNQQLSKNEINNYKEVFFADYKDDDGIYLAKSE